MSAERVRLVFLASTLRRAGPTSVLLDIVRHLDPRQFDAWIVTLSPEPSDTMIDACRDTAATIRSLSLSRTRAALHRGWRRDIQQATGIRLDRRCVVHSHGIRSDVIASTQLAGVPRVATAHNYPCDDYPMKYGALHGRWMAWRHLRAFRELPAVVACSSTLSGMLRRHAIATSVIRNGVDTARFRRALPEERARVRSALGLPADARVGVFAGTMSVRKQPMDIVRAVREIDDPSLAVILAGGGKLETDLRQAAAGDERIRFTGNVADVAHVLQAADFFVSASRAEGLPIAALEAMACGLRVVLSDIGPHRELLQAASSAGELFRAGDRKALAAAIRRASSAGRVGFSADEFAHEFGAQRMSQRYQDLYLRLVSEAARS